MDVDGVDTRDGLRKVGTDVSEVKAILITHWHNDHSTGAAALVEDSGAKVMCHADSADRLARRKMATGLRRLIGGSLPMRGLLSPVRGLLELAPPRAVEATDFLAEGDRVHKDFRVLETPGHIADHLSFFYEPEGVLFTGDAIAVAHDRVSFMSRFLTEDQKSARESMLRCIDLAPEAFCPGHRAPADRSVSRTSFQDAQPSREPAMVAHHRLRRCLSCPDESGTA